VGAGEEGGGRGSPYPLRTRRTTVHAFHVVVRLLNLQQLHNFTSAQFVSPIAAPEPPSPHSTTYLTPRLRIDLPHFAHDCPLRRGFVARRRKSCKYEEFGVRMRNKPCGSKGSRESSLERSVVVPMWGRATHAPLEPHQLVWTGAHAANPSVNPGSLGHQSCACIVLKQSHAEECNNAVVIWSFNVRHCTQACMISK
jgi:hypothetical protein